MFNFDENKAMKADGGNYIMDGGYYHNTEILDAVVFSGNGMSQYISFSVESDGQQANFNLYLTKKTGEATFMVNKIYSLMGILGIQKTSSLKVSVDRFGATVEGTRIPEFIGKKVGIRLMREDYYKTDGTIGFRMNLINFIGGDGRTYSEAKENKPAKTIEQKIVDKRLQQPQQQPQHDDDLPF